MESVWGIERPLWGWSGKQTKGERLEAGGQAGGWGRHPGGLRGQRGDPRDRKDGAWGGRAWAGGVREQLGIWPRDWGDVTGLRSTGCHCHCIVKISGAPEALGGFFLGEGTFELSLEDIRTCQDEKGQNKCVPGRGNSIFIGLGGRRPLDTSGDTLHLLLVWHEIGLEWKGFEGGKGSETGPQGQMGPEHTGSPVPQPQAEGLGPRVAVLGSEGRAPCRQEVYLGF